MTIHIPVLNWTKLANIVSFRNQKDRRVSVLIRVTSGGLFLLLWAMQTYEVVPLLWLLLLTNSVFGCRILWGVYALGYYKKNLDERQMLVRYQATHRAHIIMVALLTVVTLFFFMTTTDDFSFLERLRLEKPAIFFILGGLTLFIGLLPQMMIAWLEPDPIEEIAPMTSTQNTSF
jgi:hypothetical protein